MLRTVCCSTGTVQQTPREWIIPGTVFSTITVNRNLFHRPQRPSDLREGFGVLSVIHAGQYSGGYLVFPKYEVAVDLCSRDVLLADVHEFHGNTLIVGTPGDYERIYGVFTVGLT